MPERPDDSSLPDIVPVFPLAGVVLFPRSVLPLHIFEMRYRTMTADALAGERVIAIASLVPGHESEYEASPPIRPIGCVGRIVADEKLPDGRYNFLLQGLVRVRFGLEMAADPYRRAKFEVLPEEQPDSAHAIVMREALLAFFKLLAETAKIPPEPMAQLMSPDLTLGDLADLIAFFLPAEPAVKQDLLEDLDVGRRAVKVAALLQAHLRSIGAARPRKFSDPNMN